MTGELGTFCHRSCPPSLDLSNPIIIIIIIITIIIIIIIIIIIQKERLHNPEKITKLLLYPAYNASPKKCHL